MNPSSTLIQETTVTRKGQVTIPAGIRDRFDIKPRDKIRFTVEAGDTVIRLVPAPSQALATFGVVTPNQSPEDFQVLRKAFVEGVATTQGQK